jgi:hypothetical protein
MSRYVAAFSLCALAGVAGAAFGQPAQPLGSAELLAKIESLDAALFAAYNRCELEKFAELFDSDVEFYHDEGGVTRSREEVVENTRKYICGKVRRELVPGTLEAFPIKAYGAIALGEHRFCELASGKCEGIARFVLVWNNSAGAWRVSRVLSFGHRAAPP